MRDSDRHFCEPGPEHRPSDLCGFSPCLSQVWLFTGMPLMGSALAGLVCRFVFEAEAAGAVGPEILKVVGAAL